MKTETAIFAAGCFWGVEAAFRSLPGVLDAVSGYTAGRTERPTGGVQQPPAAMVDVRRATLRALLHGDHVDPGFRGAGADASAALMRIGDRD